MLRTTAIGLVSAAALGIGLVSPAGAHMGGGFSHGGTMGHGGMAIRTIFRLADSSSTRWDECGWEIVTGIAIMTGTVEIMIAFRFFFPAFAFGFDTYSDNYDPGYGCSEVRRVWTHAGWRYRRIWECD